MAKSTETSEEPEVMSEKDMEKRRKELIKFYSDELPLLEKRAQYEEMLTKIEEQKFARFQIRVAFAQMNGEMIPDSELEEQEEGKETVTRKLQTTE